MQIKAPHTPLVFVAFAMAMLAPCITAQQPEPAKPDKLGTIDFPTSCSDQHAHFLRGLAALHSFWYPVALDEFRETTKIEPDCMMGYWGEAMAHNHPIWGDPQETRAARKVLEKNELPRRLRRGISKGFIPSYRSKLRGI